MSSIYDGSYSNHIPYQSTRWRKASRVKIEKKCADFSTFAQIEVQTTEELNQSILQWGLERNITAEEFEELLIWVDKHQALQPNGETFGLLLEIALKLKDRAADSMVNTLLESLLETMAFGHEAFGDVRLNSLPPKPIEWYMLKVVKRCVHGKPRQTRAAQKWLGRWWAYHEQNPNDIPPPNAEVYAVVMLGWDKEGEPRNALDLLQDMHEREVQAQVYHYETCLNAYVRAVTASKRLKKQQIGYDAENVLLQMTAWLEGEGSGLVGDGSVDSTGRSSQTRVLQNLNKVVQCWVESRQREAVIRATAILDLMDDVFLESKASPADWSALAESYSHTMRAWSFAATTRNGAVRKALADISQDFGDPAQQAERLLLRLEQFVDEARNNDLPTGIPLKLWRRIYGSVISACGGELDKKMTEHNSRQARGLWDRFKARAYGDPDVSLYNHLFHVYGKIGDVKGSTSLWQEMIHDGVADPDLKTYNWRLLSYKNSVQNESLSHAKMIWNEIQEKGFSPDIISYNTLLSCYIGTRDVSLAQEGDRVFRELLTRHDDRSCQVSVVSINTVLQMWSIVAKRTENSVEREEALKSVLTILMEVHKLSSEKGLTVQPNSTTRKLVTSLLEINGVQEEKQRGVFRLLQSISGQ